MVHGTCNGTRTVHGMVDGSVVRIDNGSVQMGEGSRSRGAGGAVTDDFLPTSVRRAPRAARSVNRDGLFNIAFLFSITQTLIFNILLAREITLVKAAIRRLVHATDL